MLCKSSLFSSWLLHKNIKGKNAYLCYKIILQCIFNFSNVREVNHNGSCHKQQMINNDKLNHGKPQLQLWIDSLNEMFLSRWTAHEQWNITFILLKTRREEGHQFVNLLPDTCKICDYTVDYMCRTKTSKSTHAFAMCSIRTDLLKQENEKIDSLQIYLDFNLLLKNRNLSPITFRLPWWKNIENLTCIFVKNNLEM